MSFTIYCDACPAGMWFWYPSPNLAFYSSTPPDNLDGLVDQSGQFFYFKVLCILCALCDMCTNHTESPSCFLIYTNNLNSVDLFSSLSALPSYNVLIHEAVNLLVNCSHDLRVLHVPGVDNSIANALSWAEFDHTLDLKPNLTIHQFVPYCRIKCGDIFSLQPPQMWGLYHAPRLSQNPVIPVESTGMKNGRSTCQIFHSGGGIFQRNLGILEPRPECSPECTETECNWNPVTGVILLIFR